jgi:hypothetical protein
MNNPEIKTTTDAAWTKVATNVTEGRVYATNSKARYGITFRLTGGAAPHVVNDLPEALPVPVDGAEISCSDAVDVYVYAWGAGGSVLVHV